MRLKPEEFTLLQRGKEVLSKARESAPEDEMLVFLYDRLLRRPVWLGTEMLVAPSQIDRNAEIENPAYPAEGPEVGDLLLPEVSQILWKQSGGQGEFRKDILKIKRIVRRVRLYRPALALAYKKVRDRDIQISFIVDDARHEWLEHAFAQGGGPRKMGFVRSIDESTSSAALKRHLGPEAARLLPNPAVMEEKKFAVATARLKFQIAARQAARSQKNGIGQGAPSSVAAESASNLLHVAEEDMRAVPARPLAVYEIADLLGDAVENCSRLLAISSRDLGAHIATERLVKRIELALGRGVRTVISLNESALRGDFRGTKYDANRELQKLLGRYRNLEVRLGWHSEFHHIIKDEEYAVISNRPMLGNQHGCARSIRCRHTCFRLAILLPHILPA
jgi:hypothetical protein